MTTSPRDDPGDRLTTSRQGGAEIQQALDAWLDEALEQTFPASDAIASPPAPHHPWKNRERRATTALKAAR